jgi:hypothetical protein
MAAFSASQTDAPSIVANMGAKTGHKAVYVSTYVQVEYEGYWMRPYGAIVTHFLLAETSPFGSL